LTWEEFENSVDFVNRQVSGCQRCNHFVMRTIVETGSSKGNSGEAGEHKADDSENLHVERLWGIVVGWM